MTEERSSRGIEKKLGLKFRVLLNTHFKKTYSLITVIYTDYNIDNFDRVLYEQKYFQC